MPTIHVNPGSHLELQSIADRLGKSRKVVVITGAGISTNCGIPDFRSEDGLYSLIQAQYDAAVQNPPWRDTNTLDIDNRPKKKRKSWYYEVVAPDGEVVDIIDEAAEEKDSHRSSRSQSTVGSSSRSSTPTFTSTNASSITCDLASKIEPSTEEVYTEQPASVGKDFSSGSFSQTSTINRDASPSQLASTVDSGISQKSDDCRVQDSPKVSGCSTKTSSTTGSRSVPRANVLKSQSTTKTLAETTAKISTKTVIDPVFKKQSLTRTSILRREESSVSSGFEDDEPSSVQSSQSSRPSLPNLKGRDLFDSMVWSDPFTTSIFYMFVSSLRQKINNEVKSTTETHKFIKALRDGGRLVRNYTQNIDSLEEREGLCTDLTRGTGNRARFHSKMQREPRPTEPSLDSAHSGGVEVVLLHGSLDQLRCGICTRLSSWEEEGRESTTLSGQAPDCPSCTEYNAKRTGNGRRGLAVGRLRPDIVLYGEEHPNSSLVSPLVTHDLGLGPDVILIMGTSLKVHGLKIMIKEFAKAVHIRGGKVVFVNRTKPPESTWGDVIDYWIEWDCDAWVRDLKERKAEIWLPQGSVIKQEKRRESAPQTRPLSKKPCRPQSLRDDKSSGCFHTFRILDMLRVVRDDSGYQATRLTYWENSRKIANAAEAPLEVTATQKPAKKPRRKSEPKKTRTAVTSKVRKDEKPSKKRNPYISAGQHEQRNPQRNAELIANHWSYLRTINPNLPEKPTYEISEPLLRENCRNIATTEQKFAFGGSNNYLTNMGGDPSKLWGIGQMNLRTHPPSGATMLSQARKTKDSGTALVPQGQESKTKQLTTHQSYEARSTQCSSTAETIVVDAGQNWNEVETKDAIVVDLIPSVEKFSHSVGVGDVEKENIMPTPPCSDPLTPSSKRIKRMGSIGAILSSPTDGSTDEVWHDAPENMIDEMT